MSIPEKKTDEKKADEKTTREEACRSCARIVESTASKGERVKCPSCGYAWKRRD